MTGVESERRTASPAEDGAAAGGGPRARRRSGRGDVSMVPEARFRSYYGHPVIKAPVWQPDIAFYLFFGGLAGGSAMVAAAARRGGDDLLARRALLTALGSASISPVLLIRDLGRPGRFYNMLRVFKPTSPMNMGTWILSAFGTATGAAGACEILGVLPRVRDAAETAAAALGPALATYTGVLLADTAVPAWHGARVEMPFVFGAGAITSAGAAATVLSPPGHAALARTLCVGGAAVEVATAQLMERRLGAIGTAYGEGRAGTLSKLATGLTAAGAGLVAAAGRRRPAAVLGGAAVLAGALAERFAVFRAGFASAADPEHTVGPQRERLDRREGRPSQG